MYSDTSLSKRFTPKCLAQPRLLDWKKNTNTNELIFNVMYIYSTLYAVFPWEKKKLIREETTEVLSTLWWLSYIATKQRRGSKPTNAFMSLPQGMIFLFRTVQITD